MCHHPSVSLNKEKVSREISETKIAVCEKTQGLRSGNFSDLNSACSTVLVPEKIFQFQDMHYENRFLGTFQDHSKRPMYFSVYYIKDSSSNIGTVRAPFLGRRKGGGGPEEGWKRGGGRSIRIFGAEEGQRIIKNSGRRIIISIRHNYMQ
jgi:hypothetical protein